MAKKCSVQYGSTSSSATTFTATLLTAVDMSKSFLVFTVRGSSTGTFSEKELYVGGRLTSTTQITFYRNDNSFGSHTVVVDWFLVTFSSGIFVQRGVDDITSTVTNKTLTSINTAKSFVQQSLLTANPANNEQMRHYSVRSNISSSTNLTLDAPSADAVRTYWQVIEYQSCSVQKIAKTTGDGVTNTVTIPLAIDMAKTFLTHTGKHNITANYESVFWHFYLSSTTQITFTRGSANALPADFIMYAVSFTDNASVSRYATTMPLNTGSVNQPVSVSSLSTAFIIGHDHPNQSMVTTDNYPNRISCGKLFNSLTNVVVSRDGASAPAGITYFEVIDHKQELPDLALFLTAMN